MLNWQKIERKLTSRLLIGEEELKTSQFEAREGGWVEKDPETTQSFKRRQQVTRNLTFWKCIFLLLHFFWVGLLLWIGSRGSLQISSFIRPNIPSQYLPIQFEETIQYDDCRYCSRILWSHSKYSRISYSTIYRQNLRKQCNKVLNMFKYIMR